MEGGWVYAIADFFLCGEGLHLGRCPLSHVREDSLMFCPNTSRASHLKHCSFRAKTFEGPRGYLTPPVRDSSNNEEHATFAPCTVFSALPVPLVMQTLFLSKPYKIS